MKDRGFDYDFDDLLAAYRRLGVVEGGMVYVGSDLTPLMRYAEPGRTATLAAHLRALRQLVGPEGTVFVPTSSTRLCNTDTVFDQATTASNDMGVFAEYVRTQPDAVRSFHPFWSVAGIGARAHELLDDVARHAYGYGSVWQRFVEHDVLSLNIGKSPHGSVSVIHHIETIVGVPYRYNKEFLHPVLRDGVVTVEPFYMAVVYRECDAVRDRNRRIFAHFEANGTLRQEPVGRRGFAWSFSHAEFCRVIADLLRRDVYAWLERPPTRRPYRQ